MTAITEYVIVSKIIRFFLTTYFTYILSIVVYYKIRF